MRFVVLLALGAGLVGCAPPSDGCGVLACVSTPYTRAKGGQFVVSHPLPTVLQVMGGAPTSAVDMGGGQRAMTWVRSQNTLEVGFLSCSETVIFNGDRAASYQRQGQCG